MTAKTAAQHRAALAFHFADLVILNVVALAAFIAFDQRHDHSPRCRSLQKT